MKCVCLGREGVGVVKGKMIGQLVISKAKDF